MWSVGDKVLYQLFSLMCVWCVIKGGEGGVGVYRRASTLMDSSGLSESSKWRAQPEEWADGLYRLLCLKCGLVGCCYTDTNPPPTPCQHQAHLFPICRQITC